MKTLILCCLGAFSALLPIQAYAYDWSAVGRVTFVEGTYAPDTLPFSIDGGGGSCPAGSTLTWNARGADSATKIASYEAIIAILLTAKSTGQYVNIFGENNGCVVDFVHIQ